jgi:signal transduction histidine kinase
MLAIASPLRNRKGAVRVIPYWVPRASDLALAFLFGLALAFGEAKFHLAAYFAVPLLCVPFVKHRWTLRRSSVVVFAALLGSCVGAWFRSDFWSFLTEAIELGSYGVVTVSAFALFDKSNAARVEAETANADTELVLDRLRSFCREVSHEIRTPITISRGLIELVRERSDDPESQSDADMASKELIRLSRLVDRLIIVTASADPEYLVPEETDLEDLVSSVAQRWSAVKGRRWHLSLDATEPITDNQTVFAVDEERFVVALDCLIENAVFASEENDKIDVHLTTSPNCAVIEVRDSGCGMTKGEVAALLETTAGSTSVRMDRPRRPGGTGLGLSVVQAIVQGHGGTLAIESMVGVGTTFRITLPRPVSEQGDVQRPTLVVERGSPSVAA